MARLLITGYLARVLLIASLQILTTEEEGELAMFSRLLGGLLVVQRRSAARRGVCDSFVGSAYASFIGTCFSSDTVDTSDFDSLDGSFRRVSIVTLSGLACISDVYVCQLNHSFAADTLLMHHTTGIRAGFHCLKVFRDVIKRC
jgi:hypothetical protein